MRRCSSHNAVHLLIPLVAGIVFAAGTVGGCDASGRIDRTTPHWLAPQPAEAVELYFDGRQPTQTGTIVAYVSAEANTKRFGTVELAEAAAYDKLRALAAEAGALAVVDIEQSSIPHPESGHRIIRVRGAAMRWRE